MKRKTLIPLIASGFSFAAIALTTALVLGHNGLLKPFLARGVGDEHSYTITAADFSTGNGNISIAGETWHYQDASVSGNTVSIGDVFYTSVRSGATAENGRRGNGYTRMVFAGLDKSGASGFVYHELNASGAVAKGSNDVLADNDLTFSGTIDGSARRGIHFAQTGGGVSHFSFTSLTMYYECTSVSPEVHITETQLSVGVGETAQLHTSTVDVYSGDNPTYAWSSSDEDVATVDNNGLVTGVGAGDANITVTMTIGTHDYTDTLAISVTQAAATVVEMATLETSRIQGAGVFCNFDPSSASVTADQLNSYSRSVEFEFADPNTDNSVNFVNYQDTHNDSYTAYIVMVNGNGLNNAFKVTADFRDNANNKIYRVIWHFENGALDSAIHLAAAGFSVNEGEDLEITASKASWVEGTDPTFVFASSDLGVFTVDYVDNVATVHGDTEGSATLTVIMTIGGKEYTLNKTIAVAKAGVQHLITWRTDGEGNQRNWWQGSGIWTWVNYGELGYDGFGAFSAQKDKMTATYESEPATTIRVEVISDDLASLKVCRVYLVAGAAYSTGKLTMTIPDVNGVTYTGSITFVDGEATAYNS